MGIQQSRGKGSLTEQAVSTFASKYDLGCAVGKGAFGQVFTLTRVKDKSDSDTRGVVKISTVKKGSQLGYWNPTAVFRREADILQSLQHDNIVRFMDAIEEGRYLFLVMEACAGGQVLEQLCDLEHFHESDASAVIQQMLHAVDYIHGKRVMHRDVKAENFMFSEPPREGSVSTVKMIDFGMSSMFAEGQFFETRCGSRYYMAPEMVKKRYDHRIDMWAIGVLTYLLCYGIYPYMITNKKKCEELSHPLVWPQDIPLQTETQDFIKQILVHDPDERMTAKQALMHPFAGFSDDACSNSCFQRIAGRSVLSASSANSDLRESVRQACKVISATDHHAGSKASQWRRLPITAAKNIAWRTSKFVGQARGSEVVAIEAKATVPSVHNSADVASRHAAAATSPKMPAQLISNDLNASEDKELLQDSNLMAAGCEGEATPRGHSYNFNMLGDDIWQRQTSNSSNPIVLPNQMPPLSVLMSPEFESAGKPQLLQNGNMHQLLLRRDREEQIPTKEKPQKSDDLAIPCGRAHSSLRQQVRLTDEKAHSAAFQTPWAVLPGRPFLIE